MCGAPKAVAPPPPQAPPAPIPKTDDKLNALDSRQRAAQRAGASGFESTMLTGTGGDTSAAPAASPVLGG